MPRLDIYSFLQEPRSILYQMRRLLEQAEGEENIKQYRQTLYELQVKCKELDAKLDELRK